MATNPAITSSSTPGPTAGRRKGVRDKRLDFFRGVCLFIIFIAHVFANPWAQFIPARFGLSDAADIFVFCSGMASAAAFARVFETRGFLLGTARIAFRVWQVYWAHVAVFLICLALMVAIDERMGTEGAYIRGLMMDPFFDDRAATAVLGLMTMTYVPPFFDILPMYLVILAMVPAIMGIERVAGARGAMAAVAATWLVAAFGVLDMARAPWSEETWFFNPFAWQLVFFTGFAFMRGWLPAPRPDWRLIVAAAAVLIMSAPISWEPALTAVPVLMEAREGLGVLVDKTRMGILRYVHFLALAYLAYVAVGEGGRRLKGWLVTLVCKVGQQSLAIFLMGLVLSFTASWALNVIGRDMASVALVNLAGLGLLTMTAFVVGWFKSAPWAQPAPSRDDRPGGRARQSSAGRLPGATKRPISRLARGGSIG